MQKAKNQPSLSRRDMLKASGGTLVSVTIASTGMLSGNAWAATPAALKPENFATLVQMSRDIYPHDRFGDEIYAKAVSALDAGAAKDADALKGLEDGVAALNAKANADFGSDYAAVGWEIDRVSILKSMESDAFFQQIRSHLVTGIYNNPDVWAMLGYEGESASKGGYIERGFDDIDWL